MHHLVRVFVFVFLFAAPLLLFFNRAFGEIASQKRADPFSREECRYCHKGPQGHQIDDTKGPWCVPCHTTHNVGTTLGLDTFLKQTERMADTGGDASE
ncbi:MAG: hypothetical protein ACE5F7_06395, partial [Nitrospiria bacterium]